MWFPSLAAQRRSSSLRTRRKPASIRLMLEPLEERAVPSTTPNDPRFHQQYGLHITEAERAWDLTTGSTQVVVGELDTGVDYTHPDLYLNVWINQAEIPAAIRTQLQDVDADGLITFWDLNSACNQGPGTITDLNGNGRIDGGDLIRPVAAGGWADGLDQDVNGYTDDLIGWDFVEDDNDPMDTHGHGTGTFGIIGAVGNNGVGVAGVNWKVQIMPLRAIPDNVPAHARVEDGVAGIYYAVNNEARILYSGGALASLLPPSAGDSEREAIAYAESRDRLYVTVAQNNSTNIDVEPVLPASLNLPNMITVAATNEADRLDLRSNYGASTVHLAAPGRNIWTTWIPAPPVLDDTYFNFYLTSAAAPHVAGTAALILARNPNLSYTQIKALILDNVDPLPTLAGKTVTGGRLNIFKAVSVTPLPLLASSVGSSRLTESLTMEQVDSLVTEAIHGWQAVAVDTSALANINIHIGDLGGAMLGMAAGNTIWLDDNAAGWGWFVDKTPGDDREFTTPGNQGEQRRMDLLSVVMHEMGHVLGFEHDDEGVMAEALAPGIRQSPRTENALHGGTTRPADWNAVAVALALDAELRHKR